jgi:hypothetical protein
MFAHADLHEDDLRKQKDRLATLASGMQVGDTHRLIRCVARTAGCQFWIVEDKNNEQHGFTFRQFNDFRWSMDRMIGLLLRTKANKLGSKMTDLFRQVSLKRVIVLPWVMQECELAETTALDELAAWQARGHRGIERFTLLHSLLRALAEITWLNKTNLLHRNVSPENLVGSSTALRLCDFGQVTSVIADAQSTFPVTPYTAPEVVAGKAQEHSDQYSFAVTYYFLRTGTLPFTGLPTNRANEVPDLGLVTECEQAALKRALHRDPSCRWKSVMELVCQLAGEELPLDHAGSASQSDTA